MTKTEQPKNWKTVRLEKLVKIDQSSLGSKTDPDYQFKYVSLSDVDKGVISSELSNVMFKDAPSRARRIVKKGDILFSTVRPNLEGYARINLDVKDLIASTGFAVLSPKELSDTEFIYQYLYSYHIKKQIYALVVGSNYPAVNSSDVAHLKFNIPNNADERKAIADLLSTWDSAIEKTERLIAAKEKRFQWLLDELISKPSREGKWKEVQLKDVLTEGSKTPVSDTSSFSKITIKLRKKGLEFSANSREMADARPFYVRNKGEIIIGKQNFFNGSIAIISDEFDGCICSNAIMSFGVKHDYSKEFLFESISTSEFLKRREMLANGTGQKELSEKEFLNFKVAMPSLNEQEKIAHSLGLAQKEIDLLKFLAEKYKEQKRGLMQKLLTGEWRVKVANGGEVK